MNKTMMRLVWGLATLFLLPTAWAGEKIWVEVEVAGLGSDSGYITGQMERSVYDELTGMRLNFRFVKVENCRYYEEESDHYKDYADEYDTGEVIVPVDKILQVVRKQGDPIEIERHIPTKPTQKETIPQGFHDL
ncbi:MAG: hypothetical protein COX57_09060 [Alphaproteobacteria bacterium CG_4_10_14_0_2_um_filter_63_37]|nr:MAG: hypothetical protein AUJ55_08960 [Proteobacteria bacterium CG1_02_64_396]PJA24297.1 MAG: hypothetical protein COX57_09060 [Alphaproteobacteria bacterium CG_4_10_14_0_2_um_filter_63_37]